MVYVVLAVIYFVPLVLGWYYTRMRSIIKGYRPDGHDILFLFIPIANVVIASKAFTDVRKKIGVRRTVPERFFGIKETDYWRDL